jgi:membrane-associated phospholipid phosphatase
MCRIHLAVALLCAGAVPLRAQQADSGRGPLFDRRELSIGLGLAAMTAALMPFDRSVAEELRDPAPQQSAFLRRGARTFNALGGSGAIAFGVGAYAVGRLAHAPRLTALGLYTTEAIALSGTATALIKGVAGRQRPFVETGDADDFTFGAGFGGGGRTSFPSGHTTAAFAAATAITAELHRSSPRAAWIAGPLLYGGAALVGLARVYDDKHWASDVVAGAGIGTLAGVTVVRFGHARPGARSSAR